MKEGLSKEEKELAKLKQYIASLKGRGLTDNQIIKKLIGMGLEPKLAPRLVLQEKTLEQQISSGMLKGFLKIVGVILLVIASFKIINSF